MSLLFVDEANVLESSKLWRRAGQDISFENVHGCAMVRDIISHYIVEKGDVVLNTELTKEAFNSLI